MTEQPTKAKRISFSSREVTQIAQLYSHLTANDASPDEIIDELVKTIPKFDGNPRAVVLKLSSMGLIDRPGKRYVVDEEELDAIERSVDALYDTYGLSDGAPERERAINRAFRVEFAARLSADVDESQD